MYGFVDYGRLTVTVMSWLLALTVLEIAVSRRNDRCVLIHFCVMEIRFKVTDNNTYDLLLKRK
jgi:hypothetical protein